MYRKSPIRWLFFAMTLRRLGVLLIALAMTGQLAGIAVAQGNAGRESNPEALVFAGTIVEPGWATEFTVANPTELPIEVTLSFDPNPPFCSPLLGCPAGVGIVSVKSNGVDSEPDPGLGGVGTTYALSSTELPSAYARITRADEPEIGVDIPAVKLSAILAADPSQLLFGGAREGSAGRSNLVLTNVQRIPAPAPGSSDLTVRIDGFAADGTPIGSLNDTLIYGQTLFIGHIIAQMGVAELSSGTLRVTKTGGGSVLWGVLYSIDASGSISAVVGAYP